MDGMLNPKIAVAFSTFSAAEFFLHWLQDYWTLPIHQIQDALENPTLKVNADGNPLGIYQMWLPKLACACGFLQHCSFNNDEKQQKHSHNQKAKEQANCWFSPQIQKEPTEQNFTSEHWWGKGRGSIVLQRSSLLIGHRKAYVIR